MAIRQDVTFGASAKELFKFLTDAVEFEAVTGAPASIDAKPGGYFSCFDDKIQGRFLEIDPNEAIVEAWRVAAWPRGVYSIARFSLAEDKGKTRVTLDQSGHPEEAEEHLKGGWQKMYWEPMAKRYA